MVTNNDKDSVPWILLHKTGNLFKEKKKKSFKEDNSRKLDNVVK